MRLRDWVSIFDPILWARLDNYSNRKFSQKLAAGSPSPNLAKILSGPKIELKRQWIALDKLVCVESNPINSLKASND